MARPHLRLTDDEVVAVAVARRSPWPTALPSLRKDFADLREAAFRGARSVMVRAGSLSEDDLTATAERVLSPHNTLVVTPLRRTQEAPGAQLLLHSFSDGALLERIFADGVHEFRPCSGREGFDELIRWLTHEPEAVEVSEFEGSTRGATVEAAEIEAVAGDAASLERLVSARSPLAAELSGLRPDEP